jgi:plastocyanin
MSSGKLVPQIVKLTISTGATALPSATVNSGDSVFWYNDTDEDYTLIYNAQGIRVANWGAPPGSLQPHKSSSQVVFGTKGSYSYTCALHSNLTAGTITVS